MEFDKCPSTGFPSPFAGSRILVMGERLPVTGEYVGVGWVGVRMDMHVWMCSGGRGVREYPHLKNRGCVGDSAGTCGCGFES